MRDHPAISPIKRPAARRLPLALFLLLTGFYLLTMSGHTYSSDAETMYAVTRGIATHSDVAVAAPDDAPVSALRYGPDGRSYSPYGILPSLLALPLFAVGALVAPPDAVGFDYATRFAVTALNAPVTAATAALLTAWALRLGARRSVAVALALLYALCTFAWPYARTFFSEPLAALLLLLAAERVDAARHTANGRRALLISGLAAGLLVATRIASAIVLPVIALAVVWPRSGERVSAERIRRGFWWTLGLAPGVALILGYNLARFGTLLATGYASESRLFTTPLLEGLAGLLLSPGKSLFLYAPPVLLGLFGAVRLWRRERAVVLLPLGVLLAHLLLYARWGEWEGGGVWGPRFLLPTVPLLLILAVDLFNNVTAWGRRFALAAAVSVGALGFVGNLGGVLLNFDTCLNMPVEVDRVYDPAASPLVAQWRILADRVARYATTASHCTLGDGFFAPEGDPEAALPRRSGAQGAIRCAVAAPTTLILALDDRRPPQAPPSELRLRFANRDQVDLASNQARAYHFLLAPGRSDLAIVAATWNPRTIGFSERDDELGVLVSWARVRPVGGEPRPLVDAAIAPLPEQPRPRWAWYYDPHNQHLVDHWAWYLPRSELAGLRALGLAVGLCLIALALIGGGARLLRA